MNFDIRLLNDKRLEAKLKKDGYLVIPFLNADEVAELNKFYAEKFQAPDADSPIFHSMKVEDNGLRKETILKIKSVFNRAATEIFCGCEPAGGGFVVKPRGDAGTIQPHDDWNLVDEDKDAALLVWVPLTDVGPENGGLKVLKGSHRLLKTYRGPDIPSPYSDLSDHILQSMESLQLRAGEAIISYFNLLHASPPNQTDKARVAVLCAVVPEQAELRYYAWNGAQVEEYESDMEFYFGNDPSKGPNGLKLLRLIDYPCPQLSRAEFDEMLFTKTPLRDVAPITESV